MVELDHEPPEFKYAQTMGYLSGITPWGRAAFPIYFFDGKWWDVEWFGTWTVQEHLLLEEDIVYENKLDALDLG